ncbi:hypothetical protein ACLOJK_013521 [Asimina triloba]
MGALTDTTARRVSRPREDAARGEWRDGEERGRPTLAFAPAPETFKLIASSSHPRHHLLRSSSASIPVVYSVSGRLSLFPIVLSVSLAPPIVFTGPAPCPASSRFIIRLRSSPFPVLLAVSLAPPIGFTGPAPFPASSLFIIRLRSSPVIAVPCRPRCLSRSTHRLHRSRSLPRYYFAWDVEHNVIEDVKEQLQPYYAEENDQPSTLKDAMLIAAAIYSAVGARMSTIALICSRLWIYD